MTNTPSTQIKFIDNPHAPEVFADEVSGFFLKKGNVSITLSSVRVDHGPSPGPLNMVVVGRLTMSVSDAHALAVGLFDFLKMNGFDPSGGKSPQ